MVGPKKTPAASIATVVLVLVPMLGGCQIRPETEQLGEPVAASGPTAETGTFAGVDFDSAIYASACGLSWIEVRAGVGEGPSLDGIYGLEVVDIAVGELDDEPGEEAVVLVDCLGGDTYRPHVLGFSAADLKFTKEGQPLLLAGTGASLPGGHRPMVLDVGRTGAITVEVIGPDGSVQHELAWSPHVMTGGELAPIPDSVVHGVIMAAEPNGVLVVSVAPGVGYRLSTGKDLAAIDPDTGAALDETEMAGRPAQLFLDGTGVVHAVDLLPVGAA
ncbi:MAG: hypothetical protein ACR2OH_12920 [Microthrixaceae bacterium]